MGAIPRNSGPRTREDFGEAAVVVDIEEAIKGARAGAGPRRKGQRKTGA